MTQEKGKGKMVEEPRPIKRVVICVNNNSKNSADTTGGSQLHCHLKLKCHQNHQNLQGVAILEKAFADFRTGAKSYGSIEGGWMSEAFSALGIKSQSTFAAASATALGKLMAKDLKAGDAATFATDDTIKDGASLIGDHAYEIASVAVDKKGNPLSVTLRNPWGVDGIGNDGSNDGYVTLTLKQAIENMSGMVVAKA